MQLHVFPTQYDSSSKVPWRQFKMRSDLSHNEWNVQGEKPMEERIINSSFEFIYKI